MAHNSSNYSQRGTPASSQIIFLEDKVKKLEELLESAEKKNRQLSLSVALLEIQLKCAKELCQVYYNMAMEGKEEDERWMRLFT